MALRYMSDGFAHVPFVLHTIITARCKTIVLWRHPYIAYAVRREGDRIYAIFGVRVRMPRGGVSTKCVGYVPRIISFRPSTST